MLSISTTLALPPGIALQVLADRAGSMGAQVTFKDDTVDIRGATACIRDRANGEAVSVDLSADTDEQLLKTRGMIEGFAAMFGVSGIDWKGAKQRKNRLTMARAISCTQISPSFKRVRLAGEFSAFQLGGIHFRLLIAPDNAAWPTTGPEGDLVWPGGIDAWHRPPYTIRALGPEADWLDVDIFVHEGGRVTEWTEDLRPGDQVALTGPGGRGIRPAGWLGLVGDETALPVILRALEDAGPDTKGHAMILIADPEDIQPVTLPAGLRLDWVLRSERLKLIELFRRLPAPPETDRFIFFAGERQEAVAAREYAKSLGLQTGEYHCAAYWTEGSVPPASQRQSRRQSEIPD